MNKGTICQIGTPKEIFNNPEADFVAKFVYGNNLKYGDEENEQRQIL